MTRGVARAADCPHRFPIPPLLHQALFGAACGALALLAALCLTAAGRAAHAQETADRPPNIVLVIGDDHGFPYFGFTGSEHVRTPNLDRLASEGATFFLAHATANYCRPSLQTLITGLYPAQYRRIADRYHAEAVRGEADWAAASGDARRRRDAAFLAQIMQRFTTLPTLLADKGYASFQAGKWWEGSYENGGFTEGMSAGWEEDDWGEPGWFLKFMGGDGLAAGRETMLPVFDFIDRHAEQPFFVWYAPSLPHTPLDAPDAYHAPYNNAGSGKNNRLSESARQYYANCTWFDAGLGALLDHIDARGLRENTLIAYVNDNGWEQPPFAEYADDPILYANGGPKGKLSLHDLAFRTPIIFYWPGVIAPAAFRDDLASATDIAPTLLDYAGITLPEELETLWPGGSLRPVIAGSGRLGRDMLIGHATQQRSENDVMGQPADHYYVRTARWHFVWDTRAGGADADAASMQLYDMAGGPDGSENVASGHPDLTSRFMEAIANWKNYIVSSTE